MSKKINILITGANGQLGRELQDCLSLSPEIAPLIFADFFATDQQELDICDNAAIDSFISQNQVDVIVNCAAFTAVDKAEEAPAQSDKVNRVATGNLARAAKERGALLIHLSTDYVFDGKGPTPYTEEDIPNPTGVYGKTKYAGEREILDSGAKYIIIRTSWLYSIYGNNFVKTILDLSTSRDKLNVVFDQIGTPTYAPDLAKVIVSFISLYIQNYRDEETVDLTGVYHFSNEGVCSWYDFAVEIVKLSCSNCIVTPVTSDLFPTKAQRPPYSVMNKAKITSTLSLKIPHWRESLNVFYRQYKNLK